MAQDTHPAFVFWIEMELWAMEGLDISFPCNQPQPNVIKPEHLERNVKNLKFTVRFVTLV